MTFDRSGEGFEITTTTEFLATRLGHAVDDAYKGTLSIDKLEREAFTRVTWNR